MRMKIGMTLAMVVGASLAGPGVILAQTRQATHRRPSASWRPTRVPLGSATPSGSVAGTSGSWASQPTGTR